MFPNPHGTGGDPEKKKIFPNPDASIYQDKTKQKKLDSGRLNPSSRIGDDMDSDDSDFGPVFTPQKALKRRGAPSELPKYRKH